MKTTLADIKAGRIPEFLNVPPDDPRLVQWVNEATKRLMTRGLYWGAYATMDVAVTSTILTLPPQLQTLEAIALGLVPLPIRGTWYQFIDSGWGQRDETSTYGTGIQECQYLNNYPTIADITTAGVLTVKCDLASDEVAVTPKTVLILGYDQNNNWIRTIQDGVYADGEVVNFAVAGTATTLQFSKITDIQVQSAMDGQWWLYIGGVGGTLLGHYQHWETKPSYKRYLIPYVGGINNTARIVGRRAFIPVANDNDYLIIGNLAAMKLACRAVRAEELYEWDLATLLWNGGETEGGQKVMGALQELDAELQYELGVSQTMVTQSRPEHYEVVEPIV